MNAVSCRQVRNMVLALVDFFTEPEGTEKVFLEKLSVSG